MDESALRILLNNLDASRSSLHGLLHVFNWFVIVGLGFDLFVIIKEFWDDWKDFRYGQIHPDEIHLPKRPSVLLLILGLVGTALIVLGVAGEWNVDVQAGKIETQIRDANDRLLGLVIQEAGTAKSSAKDAADAASRANDSAGEAKRKADVVAKLAKHLHEFLTGRSLTQKEMDDLRDSLKPLADPRIPILVVGSFESGLNVQVWRSLKDAGFEKAEVKDTNEPVPYGMGVSSPRKYAHLAGEIAGRLMKAGIGPMVGGVGINADTEPIEIFIGDIRTAPLPPLK